ncbi:hypothetical protein HY224_02725 [Candidatus Uhrbacteria bacterium]|nr:hypothetical protein [Candidatus Uhrbacteria bacterium]
MDNLQSKIKLVEETEFPGGLHEKIMRKLMFLQFRTPFLIVVSLLLLNLAFTGWHIWTRLIDNDGTQVLQSLLSNFEWDFDYLNSLFGLVNEVLPWRSIIAFGIESLLVAYVFYLSATFKKMPQKLL